VPPTGSRAGAGRSNASYRHTTRVLGRLVVPARGAVDDSQSPWSEVTQRANEAVLWRGYGGTVLI
jgi:hypothetical protein